MKKLIAYFFKGLLLIAPIFITIYVIYTIISWMDDIFKDIVFYIFGYSVPGLGLVLIVLSITLIGILSSTFIFKPIFKLAEAFMIRTPLIKIIYSALKDLFSAFVSDEKKFNKPVLVTINKDSGLQKLGFITLDNLNPLGLPDKVAVYLPHSYNFSGNLFIIKKENVELLNGLSATDAMKFIVSGGVTDIEIKRYC